MQRKLRILFVAPYIPSPIRPRPLHFIKGLKGRGHSITFLGLAGQYANSNAIEKLKKYSDGLEIYRKSKIHSYLDCFFSLFSKMPLQSAYSLSRPMKKRINKYTMDCTFDIIHVEHIRAAYLLPKNRKIPAIYDSVDCITSLYNRFKEERTSSIGKLIALIESTKLKKSEPYVLSQYDAVVATTLQDKYSLKSLARTQKCNIPQIRIIENGVDSEYFKPQNVEHAKYSIVFSGKMAYYPNEVAAIHFMNEIFPLIKTEIPQARFYIVGANPSNHVRQLQQKDGVTVTGFVPDLRQHLASAHVVVCPIRIKVGIQNKLLEAMSMAKAIVTYPEPAASFELNNMDTFLVADDPAAFAENVIKLMRNDSLRTNLSSNARSHVQQRYTWEEKVRELEELYTKTTCSKKNDCNIRKLS